MLSNYLRFPKVLTMGFLLSISVFAQSGRHIDEVAQSEQRRDKAESLQKPTDDAGTQKNKKQSTLLITTAPAEGIQQAGTVNLEETFLDGCISELKNRGGIKIIEDQDISRNDAREMAIDHDAAYIVWVEIRDNKAPKNNSDSLKVRYLIFEPRTAKLIASGFAEPISRKRGGFFDQGTTIQEQALHAGRSVAKQLISQLDNNFE